MILWGGGVQGPAAPPGTYKIRLTVDGKPQTKTFLVKRNPFYDDVTDADLRAQFALAIKLRDKLSEANQAIVDIRTVKAQVADRLAKSQDAKLKSTGDKLTGNATEVEENVYQVKNQSGQDPLNFPIKVNNRLATLLSMVERGDGRPIGNAAPIFADLSGELKVETDHLAKVWKEDLAAFNAELKRLGLAPIGPKCPAPAGCTFTP
jgi:hypothetical protein